MFQFLIELAVHVNQPHVYGMCSGPGRFITVCLTMPSHSAHRTLKGCVWARVG